MTNWYRSENPKNQNLMLKESIISKLALVFDQEIFWDTKNASNVCEKINKNIFSEVLYTKAQCHYIAMVLSLLKENKEDFSTINLKEYLNNDFHGNPCRVLFNAEDLNYRTVKEAALFLEEISEKKVLAQNILINMPLIELENNFFISVQYNEILKNTQNFLLDEWKLMNEFKNKLKNSEKIFINTEKLLTTSLVKNGFQTYHSLLIELMEQGFIKPNYIIKDENCNIFEYYMLRPSDNKIPLLKKLIEIYHEQLNLEKTVEYFENQKEKLTYFNNSEEKSLNYDMIVNIIKKYYLNDKLNQQLLHSLTKERISKI